MTAGVQFAEEPSPGYLLGFDIGGTKCATILGRVSGDGVEILDRVSFATEHGTGPNGVLAMLETDARKTLAGAGLETIDVERVGISCGGPLDVKQGVVLGPPNLPGWDRVEVTAYFERVLGIEAELANDANAGALAEWWWGAGQGTRSMVFLTFGTGLGAGLILDGRLHSGVRGLAGEVGHIRIAEEGPRAYGKVGSLEGYASGTGIRELASAKIREVWSRGERVAICATEADLVALDVAALAAAARAGDPLARFVFESSGYQLGRGIAILADVLDPEIVVVGGIYVRCRDLLEAPMLRGFNLEALPGAKGSCNVVPAALGEAIGDFGALAIVFEPPDMEVVH